jgi:hypothetical protein
VRWRAVAGWGGRARGRRRSDDGAAGRGSGWWLWLAGFLKSTQEKGETLPPPPPPPPPGERGRGQARKAPVNPATQPKRGFVAGVATLQITVLRTVHLGVRALIFWKYIYFCPAKLKIECRPQPNTEVLVRTTKTTPATRADVRGEGAKATFRAERGESDWALRHKRAVDFRGFP